MAFALLVGIPVECHAYSVLTHEQVVDLLWKDDIEPLLKKRFPDATANDLRKAHAFAYGGSLVQDMGYYPFGNKFFSNLVHYVRSGDFVEALIREARDVDELAFALGALALAAPRAPNGVSFSNATNAVSAAMTTRFMTPPTNNSSISAQQQPTQTAPCSRPIRNAPAKPLRHRLIRNPRGD